MAGPSPRDLLAMERGWGEAGPSSAPERPTSVVPLEHTTADWYRALLRKPQVEVHWETSESGVREGANENGHAGLVRARRYVGDDPCDGALPPCQFVLPIP